MGFVGDVISDVVGVGGGAAIGFALGGPVGAAIGGGLGGATSSAVTGRDPLAGAISGGISGGIGGLVGPSLAQSLGGLGGGLPSIGFGVGAVGTGLAVGGSQLVGGVLGGVLGGGELSTTEGGGGDIAAAQANFDQASQLNLALAQQSAPLRVALGNQQLEAIETGNLPPIFQGFFGEEDVIPTTPLPDTLNPDIRSLAAQLIAPSLETSAQEAQSLDDAIVKAGVRGGQLRQNRAQVPIARSIGTANTRAQLQQALFNLEQGRADVFNQREVDQQSQEFALRNQIFGLAQQFSFGQAPTIVSNFTNIGAAEATLGTTLRAQDLNVQSAFGQGIGNLLATLLQQPGTSLALAG